ncbi:hypothetical protein [Streptomyces chartreusis]
MTSGSMPADRTMVIMKPTGSLADRTIANHGVRRHGRRLEIIASGSKPADRTIPPARSEP